MNDAYIVTALRTAGGKKGGRLSNWHPVDLGAQVINALLNDIDCPPSVVEDVIFGSVSQIGEQAMNVARNIVLASELPESVPATSVDRQCGSSQQALHFAAQAVMSGTMDIVIAGGVESMTRTPMFSTVLLPQKNGLGHYMSPELQLRYPNIEFSQFKGAEMMANQYAISKDELDAYALNSHRRASEAVNKNLDGDRPREISKELVKKLIQNNSTNALEIANSLLKGEIIIALNKIQSLLKNGEPALRLITTLTGQSRGWLWVHLLDSQGNQDVKEIAKLAGIANPKRIFVIRKQIQGKSLETLLELMKKLLKIEASIKSGIKPIDSFKDNLLTDSKILTNN